MKITLQAAALSVLAAIASAQVPAGGEFLVNTYTTSAQFIGKVAMEPDGDFVVVWMSPIQNGVIGQRFESSGARRGGEFTIASGGGAGYPAVAVGSGGDFVVTWTASGANIHGRRFDSAGLPVGIEFQVNTFTPSVQPRSQVGRAADGRFIVLWESMGADGDWEGIAARRFDASGNAIGAEFVVNTYTTFRQVSPVLGVEADGSFVAVWEDFFGHRDGSDSAIFGQRYDASGTRLGSEFQANTFTIGHQRYPAMSVSPGGGFVVAWTSASDVFARRFDSAGNGIGNDFLVNSYTAGSQYTRPGAVAHDGLGNFVVSWMSGYQDGSSVGVFAQRFDAAAIPRGAEFQVNTYTTGGQGLSVVASDVVGNFVVAWQGQSASYGEVFGQRFGGLGPAALAIDAGVNGVLEPGEMVEVRPSWRNVNGVAQTFSGTLTNITGPAGATYAITDGAGDYGTVADGATAPCTDCYAVSVSNPATRPVTHWDAAAVESILPDSQGQQKQWLLHVGRSFTDVPPSNGFYRFVETLLHHNVTSGCGATTYCPGSATTREQMAVFVLVAKEGAGYVPPACGATPMFADVPASNPFCRWIEELFRRAVVSGCGGGNYCPTAEVTREQMAVFVLRTLDPALSPPACTTPVYGDVPAASGFCRWIEELTRRSVVTGCGNGNYCPTAPVTREQMGVFISVTFGLTLYGP